MVRSSSTTTLSSILSQRDLANDARVQKRSAQQSKGSEFKSVVGKKDRGESNISSKRDREPSSQLSNSNRESSRRSKVQNREKLDTATVKRDPIDSSFRKSGDRTVGQEPGRGIPGKVTNTAVQDRKPVEEREDVQVNFLLGMQDELNIKPQDVVMAFSDLNERELAAPPEKTVAKIVNGLGLSGAEAEKAKEMFYGMLAQTAGMDLGTDSSDSDQSLSMEVMTENELSKKNRDVSLGEMNKSFFSPVAARTSVETPAHVTSSNGANRVIQDNVGHNVYRVAQEQSGVNLDRPVHTEISGLQDSSTQAVDNLEQVQDLSSRFTDRREGRSAGMPSGLTAANVSGGRDLGNGLHTEAVTLPTELKNSTVDGQEDQLVQELVKKSSQGGMNLQPPVNTEGGLNVSSTQKVVADQGASFGGTESESSEIAASSVSSDGAFNSEDFSQSDGGSNSDDNLRYLGETRVQPNQAQKIEGKNEFIVQAPKASEGEESANVREIINQARYIIKNGGGEMKVHLAPAGLGEVNLKVSMAEGKINVEMITSNNDAKKVMEKGLGDLKATLANLNLNVDDIKVDVARETSNQLEQDGQDESKDFQQKFLQNFQRENSRFRNGALAQAGYGRTGSQVADRSEEAQQIKLRSSGSSGRSGSGRLNLVA